MSRVQANRIAAVSTSLGEDVLLLRSMQFTESLGRPFQAKLDLFSENHSVDFSAIVGQNLTVRLEQAGGTPRYFNGFVSRFEQGSGAGLLAHYRATVVPWLWFLTRTANCRIFQETSVPDIVKQVFQERGFTDVIDELSGSYPQWEYCVQYRETDFNFVSRLMEQEGIYYFFRHENGKHSIVLADWPGAHQPFPGYESIGYHDVLKRSDREYVSDWTVEHAVQPGACALNDYDFKIPRKVLRARASQPQPEANSHFEVYDYPGEYTEQSEGQRYAQVRIDEQQANHSVISAASDATGICTGCTFELKDHPRDDQNKKYLITSASYHIRSDEFDSAAGGNGAGGGGGNLYTCHFTAIEADQQFRPARVTPKPIVQGPQTAVVVGPAGQEIYVDEFGRIKVQFFWDREGKYDENTTCFMRVAQQWAGKRWGASFWPRIGQEVVVGFLEGDPDHPIVIGSVYNGDQRPPYLGSGPDGKHANDPKVSGWKTNSTPGGEGFNELRFDDSKGKEQVFIHAQHNLDTRVRNESMLSVGSNQHETVGGEKDGKKFGDRRELVFRNHHVHTKGAHEEQVGGHMYLHVGGGDDGPQNLEVHVIGKEIRQVDDSSHLTVAKDRAEKIDGSQSLTVGGDQQEKVGKKHAVDAGQEIHLKSGMKVVIEAGMQLTLKGPGGFIDIGPAGVTVQGVMVLINSGGAAGAGTGSTPATPEKPKDAAPTAPSAADNAVRGQKSARS
jgi:type VI secretion system secreted protein VgrG